MSQNYPLDKESTISKTEDIEKAEKAEYNGEFRTTLAPVEEVDAVVDPFEAQKENNEDTVDFKSVGWIQAGFLITCEQVALGILSFPSNFHKLGMFGGVFATVMTGIMCYLTGLFIINFKLRYPGVMNFGDAGGVMFGQTGKIIFGGGLMLKTLFMGGSHILSGSIAFRKMIGADVVCSIVWAVLMTVVSFALSLSRRLEKLSFLSVLSVTSILTASLITVIATGVQDSSRLVPEGGEPVKWYAFENHGLTGTINAYTDIIFGWGGHVVIMTILSEMKNPVDFRKSLAIVQGLSTSAYVIVGATIYSFGGQYVTSPSLTMTARPVMIVAYSIALISIFVAGVVPVAVGAKYMYISMFRHSARLTENSWRMRFVWFGIVGVIWIIGFIISQVIPFFNDLLSIVSSLFSIWFAVGIPGMLALHLLKVNYPSWRDLINFKHICVISFALFCVSLSSVITPLGIYSSVMSIKDGYSNGEFGGPFSCASS